MHSFTYIFCRRMNYNIDITLPARQLSACQCACPRRLLCIISTRRKGDVVSSAILRPQTLQEVMSGSRLTPWTEDAPRQSCSGLALATWKISGSKKMLLEAGSLKEYSHGDAPRFLVSSGGRNLCMATNEQRSANEGGGRGQVGRF